MTPARQKFPWLAVSLGVVAVAIGATVWVRGDYEVADVTETLAGLNPVLVMVLMATLPVVGFSVSIVYLVAGAKFGPVLGGVAVAAATVVHLLASHWIGRGFLREPLRRFMAR